MLRLGFGASPHELDYEGLGVPLRDALRHRAELREQRQWSRAAWDVEREIDDIVSSGRTIVAGPWLSEVGFETLYWVPFLRWVKAAFRLDPSRVVAVSRGGVGVVVRRDRQPLRRDLGP